MKALLTALRSCALLIIAILLLNPYFRTVKEVQVNPKFAVLMDNSESLSIQKGQYSGISDYLNTIESLQRNKPDNVELDYFSFGGDVRVTSVDSLSFSDPSTNLFEAIDFIISSENSYTGALLLSDGIITYGKNPVVRAGESPFPIHAVALGDTARVVDIAIRNVTANQTGFTNTLHPVEVEISQYGFTNEQIELRLMRDTETLAVENIRLENDIRNYTATFELQLEEAGLFTYELVVDSLAGEWITENNRATLSIEVLDSKTRILHVTSSIHPDVRALKSMLLSDENIELNSIVYLGTRPPFRNTGDTETDYDLLILHGAPSISFLENQVPDWKDIPTLLLELPASAGDSKGQSYNLIEDLSGRNYSVSFFTEPSAEGHPILELPDIEANRLPALTGNIRTRINEPDAITLLGITFQGLQTNADLLAVQERGNIRRAHVSAFGWYIFAQSTNPQVRDYYTALFNNLVSWTSTDPDNRLLKVAPAKIEFSVTEAATIHASLINENGVVEDDATIEITLLSDELSATYTMNNLGSGSYRIQIPALPAGKYRFRAVASKGSRVIESQEGEFLISDSSTELVNTLRNDELLRGIAGSSNGIFIPYVNIESLWDSLGSSYELNSSSEFVENYFFPVRSPIWFLLVLALLGTEWFIRKKYALP